MRTDEIERQIFLSHPFGHPLRGYMEQVHEEADMYMADQLAETRESAYDEGKYDAENGEGLADELQEAKDRLDAANTKLTKFNQVKYSILSLTRRKLKKSELLAELEKLYYSL